MDDWKERHMLVRFNGGPLDGQSHEIADEPDVGAAITWPPNADVEKHDDAIPGSDDVVEYLYRGNGAAASAFAARVKVATWAGTTYNAVAAVGDVSGDGVADLLARTPAGTLYLYKGTGKPTSAIFATRVSLGTTFKQYDIFG